MIHRDGADTPAVRPVHGSDYPNINAVLKDMRDHQADWLRVRHWPEIPLANNAMASAIREYVQGRKISGGPRSAAGRRCRDTLASLTTTCRTLGVRFGDDFHDRVRGRGHIPWLADLIRQKAPEPATKKAAAVPVEQHADEHGSEARIHLHPATKLCGAHDAKTGFLRSYWREGFEVSPACQPIPRPVSSW